MLTVETEMEESTMTHTWSVSDECVDANIHEWCRMRNDGLPYHERRMLKMHKQLKQIKCTGGNYFLWMAIASLGLDPTNECDRRKINPDQVTHRCMAMLFYARIIQEIGEARFRTRWTALFGGAPL